MKTNYKKKFIELRNLNIKYMVRKISMSEFVGGLHSIDEDILLEAKKIIKKSGKRNLRK